MRAILKEFMLYRTYHGSAMSPAVQAASEAAWGDEAHVDRKSRLYKEKFNAFYDIVNPVMPLAMPEASFYFWAQTPIAEPNSRDNYIKIKTSRACPAAISPAKRYGVNPGEDLCASRWCRH